MLPIHRISHAPPGALVCHRPRKAPGSERCCNRCECAGNASLISCRPSLQRSLLFTAESLLLLVLSLPTSGVVQVFKNIDSTSGVALGERNWQGIERLVNGQIFINEQGKRGKGIMMAVLSSRAATRKYRDAIAAARSPITE